MEIKGLSIDERFQKSVNLKYDIQNINKITNYIPTSATLELIKSYFEDFQDPKSQGATVVVGPYGKGKSQTILTMLGLATNYEDNEIDTIVHKIAEVDKQASELISNYRSSRTKYLPVFISNTQNDFNQAILIALVDALKNNKLDQVTPDTSYQAAIDKINQWEQDFPDTYHKFENKVADVNKFKKELKEYNADAYSDFCKIHLSLTAGSEFNPLINMEITDLLSGVTKSLKEDFEYDGLVLVFDEFTKYLESATDDTITNELKIIQDICELSNDSKVGRVFSIFIMHKRISQYNSLLSAKIKNAFKGIEGRVEYRNLDATSKNNYELINFILKKTNDMYKDDNLNHRYTILKNNTYEIPAIRSVFSRDEAYQLMLDGCYPLTPVTAICLLRLSERIAQNERSLFTFLASSEENGLIDILLKSNDEYPVITLSKIYDYFLPLIEKNTEEVYIHNVYLKLQYALNNTEEDLHELLKSIAIIHMINDYDNIAPSNNILANALGISDVQLHDQLNILLQADILRRKKHSYFFKTENLVDLEKEISNVMNTKYSHIQLSNLISELEQEHFIVSRKYNNEYRMTRFFEKVYMTSEEFNSLPSINVLYNNSFSDGKIIYIIPDNEEIDLDIARLINDDSRSIVVLPQAKYDFTNVVRRIISIKSILSETKNVVEISELQMVLEDSLDDFRVHLDTVYKLTGKYRIKAHNFEEKFINDNDLDELMNDLLVGYYDKTPIINYELVNKNNLSGAYNKARELLIKHIILNDYHGLYEGTSAEASIYRTTLSNFGLGNNENNIDVNSDIKTTLETIDKLLRISIGKKHTFEYIYDTLMGKGFGLRKGIIPIYLAYVLFNSNLEMTLYFKDREVELDEKSFNLINDNPELALFRVEEKSDIRRDYLNKLELLFADYDIFKNKGFSKQKEIYQSMQSWYNYLPKITKQNDIYDDKEKNRIVKNILKSLSKYDNNASDVIFELLPRQFDNNYELTIIGLKDIKNKLDSYISYIKDDVKNIILCSIKADINSDFNTALLHWFTPLKENAQISSLSSIETSLVNCLGSVDNINEKILLNNIAMIVSGNYIEDWNNNTIDKFKDKFDTCISAIEKCGSTSELGDSRLIITSRNLGTIEKTFDTTENPLSDILYSELENVMDQYGDSLELSDKLSTLAKMIKEIIEE